MDPFNSTSSTATAAANVLTEIVKLPIYIFQTYGQLWVWLGIVLALAGVLYGFLRVFDLL